MANVLIAEDDEDIAFIVMRLVRRAGHTGHHAADGVAALEQAEQIRPDLVVTDLGMPRMDGFQLTQAIRQHRNLRDTPVAVLTGSLLPADPRAAAAAVCAVLLKPCDNEKLIAVVNRLVDLGRHDHGEIPSRCPFSHDVAP
jgi:CheY-like chemotaxis protein